MTRSRTLNGLRALRRQEHDRFMRFPHVLGTGLGVKRTGGEIASPHSLIVFVSRKVPLSKLTRGSRIPKYVVYGGKQTETDVVAIRGIRPEFGDAPYAIYDGANQGTLTSFARDNNGSYFGVSCAHCLSGADMNPNTVTDIAVWDPIDEDYKVAGKSGFAVSWPGAGIPGNFGFSDASLIRLEHPELLERAQSASILHVLNNPSRHMSVSGEAFNRSVEGVIDALDVVISNMRADLMILMPGGGTFRGDSGMLWRTTSGLAVGIHAYGVSAANSNSASKYSLAMSARRAQEQLQVQLLE